MNSFGKNLTVTLFGESHGEAIGAVLDGMSAGVKIDFELIEKYLSFRKGESSLSTKRREKDKVRFLSGVKDGVTTGAPIAVVIENVDVKSGDYSDVSHLARPSHADYTAFVKYGGFNDVRGGGHFSGRITAPLVVLGAIALSALEQKGIVIGSHLSRVGEVCDREFLNVKDDIDFLSSRVFAVLDKDAEEKMREEIESAKNDGDSVGGEVETAIVGLPAGIGEPWFDSLESVLAHALFSIGGIKGVEFGLGNGFSKMRGSKVNDEFIIDNGEVKTKTNRNGGINGGISNGMPVIFRCAIKPTPTIFKEQNTVDYRSLSPAVISIKGRHDPCIAPRIRAVVDAVSAITICDMLIRRYGEEFLCSTL